MKHLIPFVKRFKTLCPRTEGFSTALSARYDGWGWLYDISRCLKADGGHPSAVLIEFT